MNTVTVALCYDNRLDNQAVVTAYSILRYCSNVSIHIFVTPDNNTQAMVDLVAMYPRASLEIHVLDTKQFVIDIPEHWGQSSLFRLLLPELLPNVDRILYLDCDVVVNAGISPLFDINMEGKAAGVVREGFTEGWTYGYDGMKESHNKLMQQRRKEEYFCAGVMLFDLKVCRTVFNKETCQKALETNYPYFDQDVLNTLLTGKVHFLEKKWHDFKGAMLPHSKIIHYLGGSKPWNTIPNTKATSIWWKAAKEAGLSEVFIEKQLSNMPMIMANIVRREFANV